MQLVVDLGIASVSAERPEPLGSLASHGVASTLTSASESPAAASLLLFQPHFSSSGLVRNQTHIQILATIADPTGLVASLLVFASWQRVSDVQNVIMHER